MKRKNKKVKNAEVEDRAGQHLLGGVTASYLIQGWIEVGEYYGEGYDIVILNYMENGIAESEPLAELLQDKDIHENIISVRYYISDKECTFDEAAEQFIKTLYGEAAVDWNVAYSDVTGYLWTDQEFVVGGHDLLEEIASYDKKYLLLQVDVHIKNVR